MTKIAVCYVVHDDLYYLAESIHAVQRAGDVFAFVSRVPWNDQPGDWQAAAAIAAEAGATVIEGDWTCEREHRLAALSFLRDKGYTYALIPDGDEIVEVALLQTLLDIAAADLADRVYVHMDTYWKSPEYVIRPREALTPALLVHLHHAHLVGIRGFEGGRGLTLPPEHGVLHHLSYVGPDERIRRKITTWGHRDEVLPAWWEQAWRRWDTDKLLRNLHPTHPHAYGFAERIPVPDLLRPALQRYRHLSGGEEPAPTQAANDAWPRVSVVIPLHGGREDLRACLDSLRASHDLLHEILVVDDASPDDAPDEALGREGVRLLKNERNAGFAHTCNHGLQASTGEIVVFLNSDTVVPRAGLIRLIESLTRSATIAAAGPYTNYAGHVQQLDPTYTSLVTLDLFAEDFAQRAQEDSDIDMLVGFCLAARRSALDEIGGFDTRFGIGTFEDNDLCYRLRRAGYRLVLSGRSFVHHGGSKTLTRMGTDMAALLAHNGRLFQDKWRADLEAGYASHLSGTSAESIRFDAARHPDARLRRVRDMAAQADISLCMIARDEERVLGDCLASATPFFREMIVVDTGSTDRTSEIAQAAGAQVVNFAWPDSFADARNESLRHAQGRWIFWMDADDTLPFVAGEALLHAALNAPRDVVGFVVPVQFVEADGTASSTRVDHVKLFRNLPGVRFEGRIHEQVLPSLRAAEEGGIARCEAFVLHSGYDTSPEGQAKKRIRDARLLALDLQDRPEHPFVLFNLGMTDHYGGAHEQAVDWLRRCLAASGARDSHVRKAYALLAVSLRELGQTTASLETLEAGLRLTPDDPELNFHRAHLLTGLGRYEEAQSGYMQVLQADITGHFSSVDMSILSYKTFHNLGGLCVLRNNYREAKHWWLRALEAAPHFLPSAFELFDAALEAGDALTAQRMLGQIEATEGPGDNWIAMGLRYAQTVGSAADADAFLRWAIARHPQAVAPRMALALRLLQACREREALEHLALLNQRGVAQAAYYLGLIALQHEDMAQAMQWMERTLQLDPAHAEAREHLAILQA